MDRRNLLKIVGNSTLLLCVPKMWGKSVSKTLSRMPIVLLNTQNGNERIYTKECIKSLLLPNAELVGVFDGKYFVDGQPQLEHIAAKVTNFKLEKHILYADIDILDTPNGQLLKIINQEHPMGARLFGTGKIENNIVYDYIPQGISIAKESELSVL